jgi:hypothetical protein
MKNNGLEHKTIQIQRLTFYLLNKYGSEIILVDYWDGDLSSIGFADKTKQFVAYVSNHEKDDNHFFVSLENPPTSNEFPYSPAGDFDNVSLEEFEKLLITHLILG